MKRVMLKYHNFTQPLVGGRDDLRHSNKTMIYCGRLQSPGPALSAENVLNVPQHASGPFPPAALALGFSLDLVTNLVLLECLNRMIGKS